MSGVNGITCEMSLVICCYLLKSMKVLCCHSLYLWFKRELSIIKKENKEGKIKQWNGEGG